jgi:hypothetical protein
MHGVVGMGAAACILACGTVDAGVIPLGTSGWQAVIPDSQDPFVDIVVDGQTTDAVFIQKFAEFFSLDPINIQFQQIAPTTVTNIVINDEVIKNTTGVNWFDFHMDIVDSGDAGFDVASTAGSGGPPPIGFDISPFTTAVFGSPAGQGPTTLDIAGGVVPNGATWFPGDGPGGDGELWINVLPRPSAPFTVWTLKEYPTIPEPMALSALSLPALLAFRRRT